MTERVLQNTAEEKPDARAPFFQKGAEYHRKAKKSWSEAV